MALPQLQHRAARILNDDGTLATATFASTENGTASFYNGPNRFRVRAQLDEVNSKSNTATVTWQVRVRSSSGSAWGSWAAASTAGSVLRLAPSTNVAHATAITAQRLSNAPSGTFSGVQSFVSQSTAYTWNFSSDQYSEGECCLAWTTAATEGYQGQARFWPASFNTTSVNYNLATIESLGSTSVPVTTYTRTAGLNAALQRQRLAQAQADAGLQRIGIAQTASVSAALADHLSLTADVAAALRAVQTAQTNSDAAIEAAVELVAQLNAHIGSGTLTYQRTTDIDAALARLSVAQTQLDAAATVVDSVQAVIDAGVQLTASQTAQLDAALQQISTRPVDVDALVRALVARTAGLDAYVVLAGVNAVYSDIDAALRRTVYAQAALTAAVRIARSTVTGLDARVTVGATARTLLADFDAAVRALMVAVLQTDAAVRSTAVTQTLLDARLYDGSAYVFPTPGRTLTVGQRTGIGIRLSDRTVYVDDCGSFNSRAAPVVGAGAFDGAFSGAFD